jgi:uncharacterized metal-binding protein YceD (DUF177 family)
MTNTPDRPPASAAESAMPEPEFSRPITVSAVPAGGTVYELVAEPAELEALARRFGIVAIGALSVRLRVTPLRVGGADGVRVMGRFGAKVTRTCVVSLEDFETEVGEELRLDFLPEAVDEESEEAIFDPEEDVEPLEGDVLDLGELVAQYLSLSLEPHPRRPGVSYDGRAAGNGESDEIPDSGPFAALGELRRRM